MLDQNYLKRFCWRYVKVNFCGLRATHGVSVSHNLTVQQDKDKILVKFSKEKNGWTYGDKSRTILNFILNLI